MPCLLTGGYRKRENNSIVCLRWFYRLAYEKKIDWGTFRSVLHPLGEYEIEGIKVDGYSQEGVIYQFQVN